jgi:hypothetical protein
MSQKTQKNSTKPQSEKKVKEDLAPVKKVGKTPKKPK